MDENKEFTKINDENEEKNGYDDILSRERKIEKLVMNGWRILPDSCSIPSNHI